MINTSIGKYKITRLIGEGGMASVYEATHEMLGTKVAIKVLNPILSANEQIRERFKNEAKLMASLNHPNITKISDFDDQPNQLSIILEFLEGEDLNEKIKRQGALPDGEILSIFKQAFSAFQYAHEKGIVHRDIKPSNIYILPDGRVKILDFGIAKLFGEGNEMTKTGTQMGTPIYMSPEQVKGDKSIDFRSDIYSLGITLYAAIVGKPPYDDSTDSQFDIFNKIVYEPIQGLGIENKYNDIVAKACNKDREQRYQSCEEWLKAMNNLGLASDNSQLKTAPPISDKTVIDNINLAVPLSDNTITDNNASDNDAPTSLSENNKFSPSSIKKIVMAIVVGVGLILIISLGVGFFINSNNDEATGDASIEATDDAMQADTISAVVIGTQTWMTDNLDVTHFRNGDEIPEVKSAEQWAAGDTIGAAWCYYENDDSNGAKYGKLYNWYAVNDPRGLAPEGWHIPTDAEWTKLSENLGGEENAGNLMKSSSGWLEKEASKSGNGTNQSGFTGLPGSCRYPKGNFGTTGDFGVWWSASDTEWNAWHRILNDGEDNIVRHNSRKSNGFSVRCLKD
jgi:uncharacterized protein (TIGR02145 family)